MPRRPPPTASRSRPTHLTQIANDSFPTQEELQNVYNYKQLTEDEERQWNDLFNQVVNG